MKKIVLALFIATIIAPNAQALMTVDISRMSGYYGYHGGGEFTIKQSSGSDPIPGYLGPWQAFCVERNEFVMPPKTAHITINPYAVQGGKGGQDMITPGGFSADTLDARTAYLYLKFIDGSLAAHGYNYTPGDDRRASADSFQNVVWHIEGELVSTTEMDWYNNDAQAQAWFTLADNAVNSGAWKGIGAVRIANLFTYNNDGSIKYHQSQLMIIPAPGALLLGSLGIGLVGWLTRRRVW